MLQNFLVLGFDTFLVISTFLQREMMVRFYLVLSVSSEPNNSTLTAVCIYLSPFELANIIHSLALVLPTILINMLDSGIAHFITAERVSHRAPNEGSRKFHNHG